jgi:CheY-like chemotaxis protein
MGHKLLLADDSVTIQRVIELTFSGEDVQVLSVGDGEQAIARIPIDRPDIVLADIGMPKRSGYEVAAFVKGHPDYRHIPVLLLAGAFEPVDQARAAEVGCNGVLVKPFEPQQVIARVRELLEGGKSALAPIVPGEVRPDERPPAAKTIEFPRPPAPRPAAPPPAERIEPPAPPTPIREEPRIETFERTAAAVDPPMTPAMGPDESLDDYFDRLDAAFATLETSSIGNPAESGRDDVQEVPSDESLSIPTLDDLLGGSDFDASAVDLPLNALLPDPEPLPQMPAPIARTYDERPPAAPAPPSPPATRSVIADAFTLLLAAEQEPGGRPVRLATAAAEPVVTEAMIDDVVRRVLARIGPEAVRDVVKDIVSDIAERLVREEIERIRSKHD